jgi:hypothetical protein
LLADIRGQTVTEHELPAQSTACALDLADDGPTPLADVGALLGVSRERIRQLEARALHKLSAIVDQDLRVDAPPPQQLSKPAQRKKPTQLVAKGVRLLPSGKYKSWVVVNGSYKHVGTFESVGAAQQAQQTLALT